MVLVEERLVIKTEIVTSLLAVVVLIVVVVKLFAMVEIAVEVNVSGKFGKTLRCTVEEKFPSTVVVEIGTMLVEDDTSLPSEVGEAACSLLDVVNTSVDVETESLCARVDVVLVETEVLLIDVTELEFGTWRLDASDANTLVTESLGFELVGLDSDKVASVEVDSAMVSCEDMSTDADVIKDNRLVLTGDGASIDVDASGGRSIIEDAFDSLMDGTSVIEARIVEESCMVDISEGVVTGITPAAELSDVRVIIWETDGRGG